MLWLPIEVRTWIFQVFFDQEACYEQYMGYTFTKRFGLPKPIARLAALPVSHLVPVFFRSMRGIPVHRGSRQIIETFPQTHPIHPFIRASKSSSVIAAGDPVMFEEGEGFQEGKERVLREIQAELNDLAKQYGDI